MHQSACVRVCSMCVIHFKMMERQTEQHIITLGMVFNKEVVALLDITHCSSMSTLLPSLHCSLPWQAESKNCTCRLLWHVALVCVWMSGSTGRCGERENSKCIRLSRLCPSSRRHCSSAGHSLCDTSQVLGPWYLHPLPQFFRPYSSHVSVFTSLGFFSYFFLCFPPPIRLWIVLC